MTTATPSVSTASVPPPGLTLEQYARAKHLPVAFLKQIGLTDGGYKSAPEVHIPYYGIDRREVAVRYRAALEGRDRFTWKKGSKTDLYGLHRLADARKKNHIVIVEGESDCHTLWYHDHPAVGLPGAATFKPEWVARFEGIDVIHVIIEADTGGSALLAALAKLPQPFRDRLWLVRLKDVKDPSALHLDSSDDFTRRFDLALKGGEGWAKHEARQRKADASGAWEQCKALATKPDILSELDRSLDRCGMAGERRAAQLIYLQVTSRLLDRPVSIVVKGPSSGGKSFLIKEVLKHYPPEAYYELTAMSARALAYSEENLVHRILVIYEAQGIANDTASYLIRTLLSEGQIRYETTMKQPDGTFKAALIEREGPTGLLTTTTRPSLHPENETRLLSLVVSDTPDQTRLVMQALARQAAAPSESLELTDADFQPWKALQQYLAATPDTVVIPYASVLVTLIPPAAVRLRRDLKTLFGLMQAHTLLHKATRERNADGHLMATTMDYAVVRHLVSDCFESAVQMAVSQTIRETVQAVENLLADRPAGTRCVNAAEVATRLDLDKSATSRRIRVALHNGYLVNNETRKGRPMQLMMGESLPEDTTLLPSPEALLKAISDADGIPSAELPPGRIRRLGASGCTVARQMEGIEEVVSGRGL